MTKLENNQSFKPELQAIRELYFSPNRDTAKKLLEVLIGTKAAHANLFMLEFNKHLEEDNNRVIDENICWKMQFKTYPICFGKNYRYKVAMIAIFEGVEFINCEQDYSRYQVGDGQPKFDFALRISDKFRLMGIEFYTHLFAKKKSNE